MLNLIRKMLCKMPPNNRLELDPEAPQPSLSVRRIPIFLQARSGETLLPSNHQERRNCHGKENIDVCR
jgi:hypothetical protein